jgi:hypothetical protein
VLSFTRQPPPAVLRAHIECARGRYQRAFGNRGSLGGGAGSRKNIPRSAHSVGWPPAAGAKASTTATLIVAR